MHFFEQIIHLKSGHDPPVEDPTSGKCHANPDVGPQVFSNRSHTSTGNLITDSSRLIDLSLVADETAVNVKTTTARRDAR